MHHEKFPRELVIDTLRSPYCKLDYLKLSKLDVAKLDSKSWREYVYRGVQDWNKSLHSAAEELQAGIRLLFETVHPIVGENSWTHYVSWVENLLDNLLSIPESDHRTTQMFCRSSSTGFFQRNRKNYLRAFSPFIMGIGRIRQLSPQPANRSGSHHLWCGAGA
jgi:hypothetical protein